MPTDEQVKNLMNSLAPDQQAFAQHIAEVQLQNKLYAQQLADLQRAYDDLWKPMICILHAQPGRELRIHETQFLRFKHEYRIDRTFDKDKREVVLRLLTVHDEPTADNS